MKNNRQAAIRRILSERPVETQEELAEALREMGFQATQATVSRDMKEMRLIKKPVPGGSFRYTMPEPTESFSNERLIRSRSSSPVPHVTSAGTFAATTPSGYTPHPCAPHAATESSFDCAKSAAHCPPAEYP